MRLRHLHHRARHHRSLAVRFAYLNFVINGFFTLIWGIPVMALTFIDHALARDVAWISFLSVWALFATHAGAAIAAFAAIHAAEDNTRAHPSGGEPVGHTTSHSGGNW